MFKLVRLLRLARVVRVVNRLESTISTQVPDSHDFFSLSEDQMPSSTSCGPGSNAHVVEILRCGPWYEPLLHLPVLRDWCAVQRRDRVGHRG
jgi:hypothetical protein